MILYPQGTSYFDEADVDLICEMLDRGFPTKQIEEALLDSWPKTYTPKNIGHARRKARFRVASVAADRWNWCTHRNPLTMQLAFEGNADAWWSLNHYERRDVVLRLQYHMDNNIRHPNFPHVPILNQDDSGLAAWCKSVGLDDPQHITNPFGRRTRIRKANAEAKANASLNA